jgi:monoamine oxidase
MSSEPGAGPLGRPGQSGQAGRSGRFMGVIGAGVSGLTAAYLLTKAGHHVTLYEADDRLGGHADTHEVSGPDGRTHAVDTGFIVYNEHTYPLLTRLLAELGVPGQDSEMSMSAAPAAACSTRVTGGCAGCCPACPPAGAGTPGC